MLETILGIIAVLGFLFMMCKTIGKITRVLGPGEINSLMDEVLALRVGNLPSKRSH